MRGIQHLRSSRVGQHVAIGMATERSVTTRLKDVRLFSADERTSGNDESAVNLSINCSVCMKIVLQHPRWYCQHSCAIGMSAGAFERTASWRFRPSS